MPDRQRATIAIRVVPRAGRDEIGGERAGRLLVRVTAPPSDGRANAAVCAAIAERLGVPRSRVEIVRGTGSRDKTLRVHGIAEDDPRMLALRRRS